jgi:hypothetical protein
MKKIFVIILLCAASFTFAQTKVPEKVQSAFNGKFPKATQVKWEEDDGEFEAEFIIDSVNYSANFSEKGKWLETETTITFDALPDAVKKVVKDGFKDNEIKSVYLVEDSEGLVYYEVDVLKKDKTIEKYYNKDGSEIED